MIDKEPPALPRLGMWITQRISFPFQGTHEDRPTKLEGIRKLLFSQLLRGIFRLKIEKSLKSTQTALLIHPCFITIFSVSYFPTCLKSLEKRRSKFLFFSILSQFLFNFPIFFTIFSRFYSDFFSIFLYN